MPFRSARSPRISLPLFASLVLVAASVVLCPGFAGSQTQDSSSAATLDPAEQRILEGRRYAPPPAIARVPSLAEELELGVPPEETGRISIEALKPEGFLDYDEEAGFIYGRDRSRVRYGKYEIEADRIIFDWRLQEVQAYGNVVLQTAKDHIVADSMWYNFEREQGIAYNANGRHGELFFKAGRYDAVEPTFRRISKNESLFRDASFTTCDFSIPHYRIRASEAILFTNDRIFMRHA
ncbi:MAG: hypothetical protein V2A74_00480, partial [bacterium]